MSSIDVSPQEWMAAVEREMTEALDEAVLVVSRTWSFRTEQKIRSLAVHQAAESAESRILVGSEDGAAYMLTSEGEQLWRHETGSWVRGVAFADFGNGADVLAVVGSGKVELIDPAGGVVHEAAYDSPVSSLGVGAFGGGAVVVSGHDDGSVIAYRPERGILWRSQCPKRVVAVECCDVDFDGHLEIAAASEDTSVYILRDDGSVQDRFQSTHWIISLAVGDVYGDGVERLLIAGFDGGVYVYGGGKSAALRVRKSGVSGIAMGRLLPHGGRQQFVVGTSDQRVTIYEASGRELWRFSTSFGNRALRILESDTSPSLIVGSEDGTVHCVVLDLRDGLRETIVRCQRELSSFGPSGPTLDVLSAPILRDLVDVEDQRSSYSRSQCASALADGLFQEAAEQVIGCWQRGVEDGWSLKTGDRIYDVTFKGDLGTGAVLASSGDGRVYARDCESGEEIWTFRAAAAVRGAQWIADDAAYGSGALVGSVDGCVYRLNALGKPVWHVQTRAWILHVAASSRPWADDSAVAWFGSEGSYVQALDNRGRPMWRFATKDRARAVVVADVDRDGQEEVIAGSDDRHIYVIDSQTGRLKTSFSVPHWVLVVGAADVDGDGKVEILVGTEDGHLYVHDVGGRLLWSFRTGHWVAAVDVYDELSSLTGRLAVGSADSFVYGLSATGGLSWRWQTGARVRTLAGCGAGRDGQPRVVYGSYDEHVRMLRVPRLGELEELASQIAAGYWASTNASAAPSVELLAVVAFASRDESIAADVFLGSGPATARAMALAVVMAQETPRNDDALMDRIASFLLNEASDEDCLAVGRTLRQLGADNSIFARVTEGIETSLSRDEYELRLELLGRIGAS